MTQWLVHVHFTSVTEVLVSQWLVHVSFTSVKLFSCGNTAQTGIAFSEPLRENSLELIELSSINKVSLV